MKELTEGIKEFMEIPKKCQCSRCLDIYYRTEKPAWNVIKKFDRIYRGHYYDLYNLCPKCDEALTKFMHGIAVDAIDTKED